MQIKVHSDNIACVYLPPPSSNSSQVYETPWRRNVHACQLIVLIILKAAAALALLVDLPERGQVGPVQALPIK